MEVYFPKALITHITLSISVKYHRKPGENAQNQTQQLFILPFVEELIDVQIVPNARRHFSEEVKTWMNDHRFRESAVLTK